MQIHFLVGQAGKPVKAKGRAGCPPHNKLSLQKWDAPRQAWLLMLCEYSYEAQVLAFQTLQRRFLLEEECTNRKVLYRLHSLIQRVAIDYLPKIEQEVTQLQP